MDKVSFVLVEHSSVVLQLLHGVADRPWLHQVQQRTKVTGQSEKLEPDTQHFLPGK